MASATLALPCAAYKFDPLEYPNCGATMRSVALIDDADVIERILKHLNVWDPLPDPVKPPGPDPVSAMATHVAGPPAFLEAGPKGETLTLTYHPVPDIV